MVKMKALLDFLSVRKNGVVSKTGLSWLAILVILTMIMRFIQR